MYEDSILMVSGVSDVGGREGHCGRFVRQSFLAFQRVMEKDFEEVEIVKAASACPFLSSVQSLSHFRLFATSPLLLSFYNFYWQKQGVL